MVHIKISNPTKQEEELQIKQLHMQPAVPKALPDIKKEQLQSPEKDLQHTKPNILPEVQRDKLKSQVQDLEHSESKALQEDQKQLEAQGHKKLPLLHVESKSKTEAQKEQVQTPEQKLLLQQRATKIVSQALTQEREDQEQLQLQQARPSEKTLENNKEQLLDQLQSQPLRNLDNNDIAKNNASEEQLLPASSFQPELHVQQAQKLATLAMPEEIELCLQRDSSTDSGDDNDSTIAEEPIIQQVVVLRHGIPGDDEWKIIFEAINLWWFGEKIMLPLTKANN